MSSELTDSLIFDKDGTLWDAIDTYVEACNMALVELGIERIFSVRIWKA